MQATAATFSPDSLSGTVLLDDGTPLPFDAPAFAASGLRFLRLGQRLRVEIRDGRVVAMVHAAFPLR
jgi:hypothetical protein